MGEWEVRRVAEVNLVGSFLVAQLAARVMTDEVGGHIFLLSSTEETGKETAYTMTQGAVRALAHALDRELVGRNVQVITVPRTSQGLDTILQTCMPFQSVKD
jgi:NAD(P)-dependent dehydrogenase (short-subunit alcohol dehydrogenase family)